MKGKENRPSAATLERGGAGKAACRAATSCVDFTSSARGRQAPRLTKILGRGKGNATPGRELAELLGLDDLRELTRLVERERAAGCPIGASCDSRGPGYYMCDSPDELSAYIRSLDKRLHNVRRTRARLADTLERMTGQRRLW